MAALGFEPKHSGSRGCHLHCPVRNPELSFHSESRTTVPDQMADTVLQTGQARGGMVRGGQEEVQEGRLPGPGRDYVGALEFKGGKLLLFHPLARGREGAINRREIGLEGSIRNRKCSKCYRADQGLRSKTENSKEEQRKDQGAGAERRCQRWVWKGFLLSQVSCSCTTSWAWSVNNRQLAQ